MLAVSTPEAISYGLLLPVMQFINFGVFQYLVLLFRRRARREPFVFLLLLVSAVGSAVLTGFSVVSEHARSQMVRISNFCLALVLLVQTAHLDAGVTGASGAEGRNNRSAKIIVKSAKLFADLLILYDVGVIVLSVAQLLRPEVAADHVTAVIDAVAENMTLLFTFVLRFGLLARRKGWRALLHDDTLEIVCHVLLVAQEYPFLLLIEEGQAKDSSGEFSSCNGVPWLFIQSLCLRVILVPCVWMTIGEHHYNLYKRPSATLLSQLPDHALHELIQTASVIIASKRERSSSASVAVMRSAKFSAVVVPVDSLDQVHGLEATGDGSEEAIAMLERTKLHPFEVAEDHIGSNKASPRHHRVNDNGC